MTVPSSPEAVPSDWSSNAAKLSLPAADLVWVATAIRSPTCPLDQPSRHRGKRNAAGRRQTRVRRCEPVVLRAAGKALRSPPAGRLARGLPADEVKRRGERGVGLERGRVEDEGNAGRDP